MYIIQYYYDNFKYVDGFYDKNLSFCIFPARFSGDGVHGLASVDVAGKRRRDGL